MRIAVVGNGRMGQAVQECAAEAGDEVACVLGSGTNRDGAAITAESMAGVDVAVEFTTPDAALRNLDRLTALGVPTVVGTTGWHDRLPEVQRMVEGRGAGVVYGANFAPGVHLFLRLAREAGRLFAEQEGFDALIEETHHRSKRDAPSGTALLLQTSAGSGDPDRRYPIASVRIGYVPGIHRLTYDSADETVIMEHVVRSRRVFAAGALQAARWVVGRAGLYEFSRVLFGGEPSPGP